MNRKAPRNVPFFDWEDRPSAVGRSGLIIGINPLAVGQPNFLVVSNGSTWKTLNGFQLIYNDVSDIAMAADLNEQLMKQFLLPQNFLSVGSFLFIENAFSKTNSVGTLIPRNRIGTLGTLGDPTVWNVTNSNTIRSGNQGQYHFIKGDVTLQRYGTNYLQFPQGSNTNAYSTDTTIPNVSNPLYISYTLQMADALDGGMYRGLRISVQL